MRDPRRSLKLRFSLWFGLFAVGLAAAARYVHYRATCDLLARELDEQLWIRLGALDAERRLKPEPLVAHDLKLADLVIPSLREATGGHDAPYVRWVFPEHARHRDDRPFDWFAGVWKPDGSPVAAAGVPADMAWDPGWKARVGRLWTSADGRYRLAATAARDGCVLLAGTPLAPLITSTRDSAVFHAATLAAVVPLGLVGGWVLLSWLLRPLDGITRTAERIRSGRFDERIALAEVDHEIAGMATTINAMLDRLAEVRARLERFNADVAHQVLGPVHGILLEADATLRRPRSAEELAESLAGVRSLASRMEVLCESMLTYAQTVVADVADLPVVDLEPIVDAAVEQVSAEAEAVGVVIDNRVETLRVRGDSTLLEQVFVNLVANAVSHSPSGGVVVVEASEERTDGVVRVVDRGPGVSPDQSARIFERFVTPPRAKPPARPGHGVGLAICRGILESHGGDVTVDQTPGGGATFVVRLPRARS